MHSANDWQELLGKSQDLIDLISVKGSRHSPQSLESICAISLFSSRLKIRDDLWLGAIAIEASSPIGSACTMILSSVLSASLVSTKTWWKDSSLESALVYNARSALATIGLSQTCLLSTTGASGLTIRTLLSTSSTRQRWGVLPRFFANLLCNSIQRHLRSFLNVTHSRKCIWSSKKRVRSAGKGRYGDRRTRLLYNSWSALTSLVFSGVCTCCKHQKHWISREIW